MKTLRKSVAAALILAVLFITNSCRKADETSSAPQQDGKAAGIVFRPFSDYLSTQGSTSLVVTPVPDFVGWGDPQGTKPNYYTSIRWISVDYNGTSAAYLAAHGGPVLNTTVSGTVKEKALKDGRAQVTVTVHAENALTFSFTTPDFPPDWLNAPLDFGYRPGELLANHSLKPAVGTADFSITFYNSAPGAPIPDMNDLFGPRFTDMTSISFMSQSSGTFHSLSGLSEGTQGIVQCNQKGNIAIGLKDHPVWVPVGTTNDGFPVETITYQLP